MYRLIIFLSFLVGLQSCNQQNSSTSQPNFLVIFVDDLRPQLNCYGQDFMITPNIDRLATEGIMFDRAYCNNPVCGASRASLLTGVRPTRDRFLTYFTRADEDLPGHLSLPRYMKESGYYTLSYGKVYHDNNDDLDGWSEPPWRPGGGNWRDYITEENLDISTGMDDGRAYPFEKPVEAEYNDYYDGVTLDTAVARLKGLTELNKPFFMAVGFLKPHLPFNAPPQYWDMYDADAIELASNPLPPENAPRAAIHNWGELRNYYGIPESGPVDLETNRKLVHGYYACVSYTDALVGKLLDELDRQNMTENTVVVIFGDHGWNLGEHGLWCKHCNFDNAMRVPLIFRGPGIEKGKKTSTLAEFVDIYPTLCELAGLPLHDQLDGESLADILKDPAKEHKTKVFSRFGKGESIITNDYIFSEWVFENSEDPRPRMLYDHSVDPDENLNVSESPDYADLVTDLTHQLRELTEGGND